MAVIVGAEGGKVATHGAGVGSTPVMAPIFENRPSPSDREWAGFWPHCGQYPRARRQDPVSLGVW